MEFQNLSQVDKNHKGVFRVLGLLSNNKYYAFFDEDEAARKTQKFSEQNYEVHEVVLAKRVFKIYFDIEEVVNINTQFNIRDTIDSYIGAICAVSRMYMLYMPNAKYLVNGNFIIGNACRPISKTELKISLHIVVPDILMDDIQEMKTFAKMVMSEVKPNTLGKIDMSVYRQNANFRCFFSLKHNKENTEVIPNSKFCMMGNHPPEEGFLTMFFPEGSLLYEKCFSFTEELVQDPDLFVSVNMEVAEKIMSNVKSKYPLLGAFSIRREVDENFAGGFWLDRMRSERCVVCDTIHDNENARINLVYVSETQILVCFFCLRKTAEADGTLIIGIYNTESENFNNNIENNIKAREEQIKTLLSSEDYFEKHSYLTMEDYEYFEKIGHLIITEDRFISNTLMESREPTVVVISDAGTGKSTAIIDYIKTMPSKFSMLIIVPRRTLALQYKNKLVDYGFCTHAETGILRVQDSFSKDRQIVVLNSMCKVDLQRFDVIVIDELCSNTDQFSSCRQNLSEVVAKLKYHIQVCGRLILMDAHVTKDSIKPYYNTCLEMPDDSPRRKWEIILNTYKRGTDQTWKFVMNNKSIVKIIEDAFKNEKKFVICCTTKTTAQALYEWMSSLNTGRRVELVTGATSMIKKSEIIANFEKIIEDMGVIIFNTAITVGVSSDGIVDMVICINNNKEVDPRTHWQQTQRCRGAKTFFMAMIDVFPTIRPTNITSLKNMIFQNNKEYAKYKSLEHVYDPETTCAQITSPSSFQFLASSDIVKNKQLKSPIISTMSIIKSSGGKMELLENAPEHDLSLSQLTKEYKKMENNRIASARCRNIEEIMLDISMARELGQDPPAEVLVELSAVQLRSFYRFSGQITEDFVKTYKNTKTKMIYTNNWMLGSFSNYKKVITECKNQFTGKLINYTIGEKYALSTTTKKTMEMRVITACDLLIFLQVKNPYEYTFKLQVHEISRMLQNRESFENLKKIREDISKGNNKVGPITETTDIWGVQKLFNAGLDPLNMKFKIENNTSLSLNVDSRFLYVEKKTNDLHHKDSQIPIIFFESGNFL